MLERILVPEWLLGLAMGIFGIGLWLLLPPTTNGRRRVSVVLLVLGTLGYLVHVASDRFELSQLIFWGLALWTITASALTIAMPSAVYAAIWFAGALGGVAGLLLWHGAQFLGVVTIIIYAGAIVVMFLFVIMLAQPRGHAFYERISWSGTAKLIAVFVAAVLPVLLAIWPARTQALPIARQSHPIGAFRPEVPRTGDAYFEPTAQLGREFYTRYWIHLELVGTLLLAALIGATVIVLYGRVGRDELGPSARSNVR